MEEGIPPLKILGHPSPLTITTFQKSSPHTLGTHLQLDGLRHIGLSDLPCVPSEPLACMSGHHMCEMHELADLKLICPYGDANRVAAP